MTQDNLAIVMGPNLIRPKTESSDFLFELRIACEVVLHMIQNYTTLFPNAEASPSVIQVNVLHSILTDTHRT
jgi:hypothetical protein